jgi:hypothetical protein
VGVLIGGNDASAGTDPDTDIILSQFDQCCFLDVLITTADVVWRENIGADHALVCAYGMFTESVRVYSADVVGYSVHGDNGHGYMTDSAPECDYVHDLQPRGAVNSNVHVAGNRREKYRGKVQNWREIVRAGKACARERCVFIVREGDEFVCREWATAGVDCDMRP